MSALQQTYTSSVRKFSPNHHVQMGCGPHPAYYTIGRMWLLKLKQSGRSVKETIHIHRVMRLRTHKELLLYPYTPSEHCLCMYLFIYDLFNSRVNNSDFTVPKVKITVKN